MQSKFSGGYYRIFSETPLREGSNEQLSGFDRRAEELRMIALGPHLSLTVTVSSCRPYDGSEDSRSVLAVLFALI